MQQNIVCEMYTKFDDARNREITTDPLKATWLLIRQNNSTKAMRFQGEVVKNPAWQPGSNEKKYLEFYAEAFDALKAAGNMIHGLHANARKGYFPLGKRSLNIPGIVEVTEFVEETAIIHKTDGSWVVEVKNVNDFTEKACPPARARYWRMVEAWNDGFNFLVYVAHLRPTNGREGFTAFLKNYQMTDEDANLDVIDRIQDAIASNQVQGVRTALTSAGLDPDNPTQPIAKRFMVNRYGFAGQINMYTVVPGTVCTFWMGDDDINHVAWEDPTSDKGQMYAQTWKNVAGFNSTIRVEVPESAIIK